MTVGGWLVIGVTVIVTGAAWLLALFTRRQVVRHLSAAEAPRHTAATEDRPDNVVEVNLRRPVGTQVGTFEYQVLPAGRVTVPASRSGLAPVADKG